jgi:hypothetical protein
MPGFATSDIALVSTSFSKKIVNSYNWVYTARR